MIRFAIVEDNEKNAHLMNDYLHRYGMSKQTKFKITLYSDGSEIIQEAPEKFDIILMDIEMKQMDGMEAAKIIRQKNQDVIIMFITQAPQYAMAGFEVDALDYILNPLNYFPFSQRLERAIERLKNREQKFTTIETGGFVKKLLSMQSALWKSIITKLIII